MGARFKCKKCKRRFNVSDGREAVYEQISACEKPSCALKHRDLSIIPKKAEGTPPQQAANDSLEETVEVFEDIPSHGLVSYKDMRKRHGFGK